MLVKCIANDASQIILEFLRKKTKLTDLAGDTNRLMSIFMPVRDRRKELVLNRLFDRNTNCQLQLLSLFDFLNVLLVSRCIIVNCGESGVPSGLNNFLDENSQKDGVDLSSSKS